MISSFHFIFLKRGLKTWSPADFQLDDYYLRLRVSFIFLFLTRRLSILFLGIFSGGNLVTSYHPYSLGSPTLPDIHQIHRENHQGIVNGFELSPVLGAFQPYSHFSLPASPRLSESSPSKSNFKSLFCSQN